MKKLIFSAALVLSLGLAACGSEKAEPNNDTNNSANETNESTKTEGKQVEAVEEENEDVYFKDNEVKLIDLKINITETKVIQPGEAGNEYGDKPVFAIWYDTTNLSDKDIDPSTAWIVVFTAIQDNNPNAINELEMGALPDDSFLDSQMETIKNGGTVKNAVAYELDDSETPVTLVATQGIAGDELGRQDFEIK